MFQTIMTAAGYGILAAACVCVIISCIGFTEYVNDPFHDEDDLKLATVFLSIGIFKIGLSALFLHEYATVLLSICVLVVTFVLTSISVLAGIVFIMKRYSKMFS